MKRNLESDIAFDAKLDESNFLIFATNLLK